MNCPYCQQEIKIAGEHTTIMSCFNGDCKGSGLYGEKAFWQELIRTRKALDMALDWLKQVATLEKCDDGLCREFTKRKLDEIKTVLEPKMKDIFYYQKKCERLETELERTRKVLDVAKLILKNLLPCLDGYERLDVEKALDEIKQITETPAENVRPDTKSHPVNVRK